jgi:hypothetical protein
MIFCQSWSIFECNCSIFSFLFLFCISTPLSASQQTNLIHQLLVIPLSLSYVRICVFFFSASADIATISCLRLSLSICKYKDDRTKKVVFGSFLSAVIKYVYTRLFEAITITFVVILITYCYFRAIPQCLRQHFLRSFALCQDRVRQNKVVARSILFPRSVPTQIVTRDTPFSFLPTGGLSRLSPLVFFYVLNM